MAKRAFCYTTRCPFCFVRGTAAKQITVHLSVGFPVGMGLGIRRRWAGGCEAARRLYAKWRRWGLDFGGFGRFPSAAPAASRQHQRGPPGPAFHHRRRCRCRRRRRWRTSRAHGLWGRLTETGWVRKKRALEAPGARGGHRRRTRRRRRCWFEEAEGDGCVVHGLDQSLVKVGNFRRVVGRQLHELDFEAVGRRAGVKGRTERGVRKPGHRTDER